MASATRRQIIGGGGAPINKSRRRRPFPQIGGGGPARPAHDSTIHSFMLFLERLYKSTRPTTQRRSRHSTDTASEFHAEASQATVSEGLAQGHYVTARAGFETATLRTKGDESTNEPPRHTANIIVKFSKCCVVL